MEATDTLPGRDQPYLLLKELARGSLGRLLRKVFDWQLLGFRQPSELKTRTTLASRRFSAAAVCDDSQPALEREFAELINEFGRIALDSTIAFTEQSMAWRQRGGDKLPLLFGVGMNDHPFDSLYELDLYARFLQGAFHCVIPMPTWRELEPEQNVFCWHRLEQRLVDAVRFGFHPVLGPLICFEESSLPGWLLAGMGQDGFFETRATRFVNAVTERYGTLAHAWILASRLNSFSIQEQSTPELSQLHRVTLIRILAQQMRSRGIETPILVGINQPWGEYAIHQSSAPDQVRIAESLVGCPEIDSFLLEINFGFDRHSTFPRDPMSVSAMIDQWSFLGKRVYISLSVPSATDGNASEIEQAVEPEFQWSEGLQQYWTELLLRTILGKRMVSGVFWSILQDPMRWPEAGESEEISGSSVSPLLSPSCGLIDSQRILKLAFKQFEFFRKSFLK